MAIIKEAIIGIDPTLVPTGITIPAPNSTDDVIEPTPAYIETRCNRIRKDQADLVIEDSKCGVGYSTTYGIYRTLISMDLSEFENTSYNYAYLKLFWTDPIDIARTQDTIIEVYRPLPYNPDYVSWKYCDKNKTWSHPGGDWYDAEGTLNGSVPFGTFIIPKDLLADNQYYKIDITKLLRYYDSSVNTGFLLKDKNEVSSSYVGFASPKFKDGKTKPKVVISDEEFLPMEAPYIYIKGVGMEGAADLVAKTTGADVQINQALSYAMRHPQYTHIYLKGPFTYKINNKILMNNNLILEGDASAVIQLDDNVKWAANNSLITQVNSSISNVTIRGLTIDGNRAGNENTTYTSNNGFYTLISFTSGTNIEISELILKNNLYDGIFINNSTNLNIYGNVIEECGRDGIYILNSNDVDVYNNRITTRVGNGISVYNTDSVSVRDNRITSNGSGKSGIAIFKNGSTIMTTVNVLGNTIYDCQEAGIWVYGYGSYLSATSNIIIKNNLLYNNGIRENIYCAGLLINGFNATIENNTFDSNYGGNICIRRAYTTDPVISDNIIMLVQNNNNTNVQAGAYGINNSYTSKYVVDTKYNLYYGNEVLGDGNYGQNFAAANDILGRDPLYADPTTGDYHEKSKCGRWANTGWVADEEISPCIDAGNPESDYTMELAPYNGGRVNTGAYGGTIYASLTGDVAGPSNKAPVLVAIANQSVRIGHTLSFTIAATDEDVKDTITYSMSPEIDNVIFNTETGDFSWIPVAGQEGTYDVTFTASDGRLSDSQTISIGVLSQNIVTTITKMSSNRMKQSSPTSVLNTSPFIDVGGLSGSAYRSLLWIDLSEFEGKTITSATLSIYWYYPEGKERVNDTIIDVYRPLPWDPDGVSWNTKDAETSWISPGGDWYDSNAALNGSSPFASLTLTKTSVPDNAYHTFDVKDLVQAYSDGVYANTGFLLKARTESNNYIACYSLMIGIESKMCKLDVQYVA